MKQSEKTRLMVMTALFAALIFVATRINIPTGINNRIIHVGDAAIYLAACILPMPYAMISGAIGAGLADFMTPGAALWIIPTMIIKPLLVPFFTAKNGKFIGKRNLIAPILAGITGLVGYAIAEGIIFGNFIAPIVGIPVASLQPIGSAILFVIIAYTFDTMKLKAHLTRQLKGSA
ncbi:TIGR04002 family protein [Cellulosilyticum sp. I15G10I2]|uniref:TIGR04002 family protein n=1 Tax=Cellulosilyticum sp. I15G10I2 TaxID=1892843 RepID=UPI00085BE78E|nr:TIGR04002 family protein [Cellulosilyticum sp. I15G10I2]